MRLVGNEVRSNDTDDAVPEPVGGGGETDTTGTDGEREDFTNDDPGSGTPGHGEDGDVQADESNHGSGGIGLSGVGGGVLASGGTNDTDDELHDDHTSGTEDQKRATTNLLNQEE